MLLIATVLVYLLGFANGQECDKPTDAEIESLITESLQDVNGDGGASADITITQLNSTLACLASASTENKYQFVSVVAQYTRMDGSDPQYNQTGQFEFECASGSAWRTTGDELGTNSRENRNVSVDASRFSATERTDCFMCIKPGHSQLALLVGSSPVPDEVHHCLACSGCNDPQLCYLPNGFTPPARGACCNAYEGGMCVETCSAGTVLVANDRECVTECPTGLYNVSGVCECSCQNGGTCGSSDSEQCDCPSDYSGMFCETCSKQCQNGGTLNTDECFCMCVEGFAGDNCKTNCSSLTDKCKECSETPLMCTACEDGYTITPEGTCDCSSVTDNCKECSGTPLMCTVCEDGYTKTEGTCTCDPSCQNGGTQDASSCECSCPVGFSGSYCGDKDCPSLTDNCKECSGDPLTCTLCEDGYTLIDKDKEGPKCEKDESPGPGEIAGIVIGSLLLILIVIALVILAVVAIVRGLKRTNKSAKIRSVDVRPASATNPATDDTIV